MKLSIIIPVYNAQKYLHKCLESILCQQLDGQVFEVILINDGSTDTSLEIAESFTDKISNYTIFSHKNQGEAVSRNVALTLAKGEYITFLDSDDYYADDCLETALAIIDQDDLDILYLRLKQVDEEGNFLQFVYDLQNKGIVSRGLRYDRRPFPATIYKREIIADITFPLGILIGPDSVFNAKVQSHAERVSFTQSAVYNYTYRTDSLSKKGHSDQAFQGFLTAIADLRDYQTKNFQNDIEANEYFDKVYKIFVTRIIDLNIIPQWNGTYYKELVNVLQEMDLRYVIDGMAFKYPYVSTSFRKFKAYQQYMSIKSIIYKIIHRA